MSISANLYAGSLTTEQVRAARWCQKPRTRSRPRNGDYERSIFAFYLAFTS
jgi:hypothetical protein